MKKSFMTRVLAVSLSAAMAFSLSSANMMTASAATVSIAKTKTLTAVTDKGKKLKLKNNANKKWKIKAVSSTKKAVCSTYGRKAQYVKLNPKKAGKTTIRVRIINKTTKKTKLLKCKVTVVAQQVDPGPDQPGNNDPVDEDLKIYSVFAPTQTEVVIRFSKAVDKDSVDKENFKVTTKAGAPVNVQYATPSADGTEVTLVVPDAALNTEYNLTITGLTVGGVVQAELKNEFTTPTIAGDRKPQLTAGKTTIEANGADNTELEFKLYDSNGQVDLNADGLEIEFTTVLGRVEPSMVTMQDGVATVRYTSRNVTQNTTDTITATVRAATGDKQQYNNLSDTLTLTLVPNLAELNAQDGVFLVSAESDQADRIIAYFNKPVDVTQFMTPTGRIDTTKATIEAWSGLNNSLTRTDDKKHVVVGLLPVDKNPNAMQVLISEDKALQDNSNVSLRFEDKRFAIKPDNTVSFKLTDAYQPAALRVTNNSLRELEIYFSEAMMYSGQGDTGLPNTSVGNNSTDQYAANIAANYYIDGKPLSSYGGDGTDGEDRATATILGYQTIGNPGTDNRHVVRLRLGKKGGIRQYLTAGTHSVTINNVGDWAAATDGDRNIINNQILYFEVKANTDRPTITTEVQSPEQIKVTFNEAVERVDGADNVAALIKLQSTRKSVATENWKDVNDITGKKSTPNYTVTQMNEDKGVYLIELRNDWTQIYDTDSTGLSYPGYRTRVHVDKEALYNVANGLHNTADIDVELTDPKITTHDNVSPTIDEIDKGYNADGTETDYYVVTMSEPVQISNRANNRAFITPSQREEKLYQDTQIAVPQANFESVETGNVIPATIIDQFAEDTTNTQLIYDSHIMVRPDETLTAGNWKLVIRSISDDYGNAAETRESKVWQVAGEQSGFKMVWAAVSDTPNYKDSWMANKDPKVANALNTKGKYIFVKFNKQLSSVNAATDALSKSNFMVNNNPLPANATIKAGILGYDDGAIGQNYCDSITIDLSKTNMEVNVGSTWLLVSSNITAKNNEKLANGDEYTLPYNAAYEDTNLTNDAVYGNADSETDRNSNADYVKTLNNMLKNDKYRVVRLRDDVKLTEKTPLKITRPVVLDLNGHQITFESSVTDPSNTESIKANFDEAGTVSIINGSKIEGIITINTPNADWSIGKTTVKAPSTDASETNNTDSLQQIDIATVDVKAIPSSTISNFAKIEKLIVEDTDGAGIVNNVNSSIKAVVVDTGTATPTISLENKGTVSYVGVESNITLQLNAASNPITNLGVHANVTVKVPADSSLSAQVAANGIDKKDGVSLKESVGNIAAKDVTEGVSNGATGQAAVDAVIAAVKTTVSGGSIAVDGYYDSLSSIKMENVTVKIDKINGEAVSVAATTNAMPDLPDAISITKVDGTAKITLTVKYEVDGVLVAERTATVTVTRIS